MPAPLLCGSAAEAGTIFRRRHLIVRGFMASLNLSLVYELIAAREAQHGGGVGAPPVLNGLRVGTSINRSCIVMLSANLQAYVGDAFYECSTTVFTKLIGDADREKYRKGIGIWGNPNPENITKLFMRLGIIDVFSGLSWQGTDNIKLRKRLSNLNTIRNQIAHGASELKIDNKRYSLSLAEVKVYRNFASAFGTRFHSHALAKVIP